jgi:hypothetical protein
MYTVHRILNRRMLKDVVHTFIIDIAIIQSHQEVISSPKLLKIFFIRIYYGHLIYYINLLTIFE